MHPTDAGVRFFSLNLFLWHSISPSPWLYYRGLEFTQGRDSQPSGPGFILIKQNWGGRIYHSQAQTITVFI
jgi:hypothetical protein